MNSADPPRPSSDDSEAAVLSLLGSREWEARLEVAREQRRQVLKDRAAAKEAGLHKPRETTGWEERLDAARHAREAALNQQATAASAGSDPPPAIKKGGGPTGADPAEIAVAPLPEVSENPATTTEDPAQSKQPEPPPPDIATDHQVDPLATATHPPAADHSARTEFRETPGGAIPDAAAATSQSANPFTMSPPPVRAKPAERPQGRFALALVCILVVSVLLWGLLGHQV